VHHQIIISGFGGQGTLFAGEILTHAGMEEGHHVAWLPSYGPEMRGGTARCTVTISDETIGSPVTDNPTIVIAMNPASLERFEPQIRAGGLLIMNSSLILSDVKREDIQVIRVPATEIAAKLGNERLANMVLLGALVKATGILSMKSVEAALEGKIPERRRQLLELNKEALKRGVALAEAAPKG
jgi:2-oxoglutarate ferredoxin oxidoreductase subunit gamma